MGIFDSLKNKIIKTRTNFADKVNSVLAKYRHVDEDLFDELEEVLLLADLGYDLSGKILDRLRAYVRENRIEDSENILAVLETVLTDIMDAEPLALSYPAVVLVVGVNGVGKTTTIAKLANYYKTAGLNVMLSAADTFRAAASEQLSVWADRIGVRLIKYAEGADPAAVVFDSVDAAKHAGTDILIIDTAGRLHNKKNLMSELDKIKRVIEKECSGFSKETFLVIDATTGQNAILQAKMFAETTDVTGVVLTKMDGTAKGGVVCAVKETIGVPVRFVGVGEGVNDIMPFNASEFAKALIK